MCNTCQSSHSPGKLYNLQTRNDLSQMYSHLRTVYGIDQCWYYVYLTQFVQFKLACYAFCDLLEVPQINHISLHNSGHILPTHQRLIQQIGIA